MRLSAPELLAQRSQAEAADARSGIATRNGAGEDLPPIRERIPSRGCSEDTRRRRAERCAWLPSRPLRPTKDLFPPLNTMSARRVTLCAALRRWRRILPFQHHSAALSLCAIFIPARYWPASGQAGAQPIVRIVDTNRLRLVVPIPEAEVGEMKQGQSVALRCPPIPAKHFMRRLRALRMMSI